MEKSKLKEIRDLYKERKQLRDKIVEFENMRISPRSAVYGKERVQTSARGDIQADNIAVIDELIEQYNIKLKDCVERILEFEKELEKLTAKERKIMRYYYIDCMTWEKICVITKMSWTNIHRIKNSAHDKITRK